MSQPLKANQHLFAESSSIKVRSVELHKTDSAQAHREKLAKILLDDMYQFVALLDAQGTLLEVNRAALEGAGIRLEDIQGKPFWEARWWQVSAEAAQRQQEACARAAQGEFVRYDAEIFGSNGGDETIIIDYSDAEIARKGQELQRLFERVTELDELKSQFFANVSHELRTPLALIVGPADTLLQEGHYLTQEHHRAIQVIKRNASTLLKHVNDLLDISKLDAGKMSVAYVKANLGRLVHLVASHFEVLASDRGVRLLVDAPSTVHADVDPEKIERVILNLLSNAFKFTPPGGRIKLSLQTVDEGKRLILAVQDSGPGVKHEDRELIFERFRQSDGGSTRQFGGTGLGLSIARDFVAMHDGLISVTDAPGGGALFQVELPLQAPDGRLVRPASMDQDSPEIGSILSGAIEELRPIAGSTSEHLKSRTSGQAKVLVVEDNAELNRFIVESLAPEFEVESAFDGEQGLEQARSKLPDLIVTDIMMPKMSGDHMLRELRATPSLSATPVIILSARADDDLRLKLLENGAQDYVMKPFAAQELRSRVRNLILVKKAQDQLAESARKSEATADERAVQLAAAEKKFKLLVESVEDYAIYMLSADGIIESWNRGAERLTGYMEHEAVGHHHASVDLRDSEAGRLPDEELIAASVTGRYEEEGRRRRKDGSTYFAQLTVSRIQDSHGHIIGYAKVIRDITRQKSSEEALVKSEAKFRRLAQSNILGVVQYQGDELLDPNDAVLSMLGYSRDEYEQRRLRWRDITPPEGDKRDAEASAQLQLTGVMEPLEKELLRKDGSRAVAYVGAANFIGSSDEGIAYLLDVSEFKNTGRALKESEAKFRSIANAMPQMVWSSLPDGFHDYFNDRWYHFTGMPAGSTDGERWNGMFHPDDQERAWDVWRHSLSTGEPYEIQYRLRHRSGEYRWTLGRALPVEDEHGAIIRWMGTCTDIHDQKLTEEELKLANRRKDEFLAMLAHELRNPMAPISTAAQLLKMPRLTEKQISQSSEIISRQVKHMTSLVDDLLDVSRVTRGLVELDREAVDIKSVVASAIEQARPLLEARNHELVTRIASANAIVKGDRTRLVQVISNLLNNAVKYTPAGGRISLEVEAQQSEVVIGITDNGIGIEPALLPHVFELFTQGERTPDRSAGGLGLGLALVDSLVALHEGRVSAQSKGAGTGSTFTIVLPLWLGQGAGQSPTREASDTDPACNPLRILIVDDNVDAADGLAALLSIDGHQVTVACHPREALISARTVLPQVFILDIGLPEIDGFELARRLQAEGGKANSLYVALTGYGQARDKLLSKAAGFHHHFVKPVDTDKLQSVLSEYSARTGLKGRRQSDGLSKLGGSSR